MNKKNYKRYRKGMRNKISKISVKFASNVQNLKSQNPDKSH